MVDQNLDWCDGFLIVSASENCQYLFMLKEYELLTYDEMTIIVYVRIVTYPNWTSLCNPNVV